METILATALGQDTSTLAAAEKRDLLARLLGRLAHEIRNPLSSLDVHVQLLEEDLGTLVPGCRDQLVPRLEIIRGELHRLDRIVSQFVHLASPTTVELEEVGIPELVNHVCELLRPEAAAREIAIQVQMASHLPRVLADPVRLTQAMLNLLINAMQAIERQGRISVDAALSGLEIAISVRDTGPGVPAERLGSIFDPYFTTKAEGHGLGLWIAQQIVTAHGGTLSAGNEPLSGAVFTMRIPIVQATENREPSTASALG